MGNSGGLKGSQGAKWLMVPPLLYLCLGNAGSSRNCKSGVAVTAAVEPSAALEQHWALSCDAPEGTGGREQGGGTHSPPHHLQARAPAQCPAQHLQSCCCLYLGRCRCLRPGELVPSGPSAGASRWQCVLKHCLRHWGEGKSWVLGVQGTHILVSLGSHGRPCDILRCFGVVLDSGSSWCW